MYPPFIIDVRQGKHVLALQRVLLWALFQSLAIGACVAIAPERGSEVILRGAAYTTEMLHWIRTGQGAEGSLPLFLPLHLKQYSIFCSLSLVTLGSAALLLGTYLLNYMNFYVVQLVQLSANPWLASFVGWPPWSLLRLVGFIATGAALTALGFTLLAKMRGRLPRYPFPARLFYTGLGLVVADIVVKALLAPTWRRLLKVALLG
ncbi:MAG: hypothetical protein QNJ46_35200 [Leptolyngbyaceae cyanobacterium MO_188.B28]|nr:hypothetical protein [Leptolyngbyaceae cyanobacterium MO_188.B28]